MVITTEGERMAKRPELAMYSTKEAAVELGLSVPRVTQLRKALGIGRIVGRSVVFTEADIETMRQRDTQRGPKPKKGRAE